MKRTIYLFAMLMVLAGISLGGFQRAQAQEVVKDFFQGEQFKVYGMETSAGNYDFLNEKCWGNTFAMTSHGDGVKIHFAAAMNYVEGVPNPEAGNTVDGGTWTVFVYKGAAYQGSIFGEILSGDLKWIFDEKSQRIVTRTSFVKLRATGGTEVFRGVTPESRIFGEFNAASSYSDSDSKVIGRFSLIF